MIKGRRDQGSLGHGLVSWKPDTGTQVFGLLCRDGTLGAMMGEDSSQAPLHGARTPMLVSSLLSGEPRRQVDGGSKRGMPLATPSRNGPAPAGVCWFGLLCLLRLMELSVFGGGGESQGFVPERTEVGALRLVPGSVTQRGEQVQTGWSLTQAPHQTRHTTARPSPGQAKGYTCPRHLPCARGRPGHQGDSCQGLGAADAP